MKKQRKQFVLLLIVLVLLVGGYLALNAYNEKKANEVPVDETVYLTRLESDSIIRLDYTYEGESYVFVKEEDTWKYEEDASLNLNQNRLNTMASRLVAIKIQKQIDNVTDLSQYGLEEPEKTITFATASESYTILVGDYNKVENGCYICEPEGTTVYFVPNIVKSAFNTHLEELIEEEEEESTEEAS